LPRYGAGAPVNSCETPESVNPVYQQALMASPGMADGLMYQELVRQSNFLAHLDCFRWYAVLAFFCVSLVFLFREVKSAGTVMAH